MGTLRALWALLLYSGAEGARPLRVSLHSRAYGDGLDKRLDGMRAFVASRGLGTLEDVARDPGTAASFLCDYVQRLYDAVLSLVCKHVAVYVARVCIRKRSKRSTMYCEFELLFS